MQYWSTKCSHQDGVMFLLHSILTEEASLAKQL